MLEELVNDVSKIVGSENAYFDLPTRILYAQDPMPYDVEERNIPYVVVRPANAEEVSKVLKYANEKKVPVHVHGAGTSLGGLARPKTNCILIDMRRLNEIKVYPERGYFEAGAGARVWEVRRALAEHSCMLPAFPGSERIATIGGIVATNTSAHAVDAALGKPGDFVLGLEVVLPTGEVIETGTESTRRPAGVELTKLFVGCEGIFGVITKVRMRLIPNIRTRNIVAYFDRVDGILDTVMDMYRKGVLPPLFFEFLDESAAKIGFEAVGLSEPKGSVCIATVHDWTEKGVDEKAIKFLKFLREEGAREAREVVDEVEWKKIWGSRAEVGNYLNRKGVLAGVEITPRVDFLKDAYYETKSLKGRFKSYKNPEFYSFGHVGAPTLHAEFLIPTKDVPNEVKKRFIMEVRIKTEEINAKYRGCGGEWGITAQRIDFIKKRYGDAYYELLKKLKSTLDPNNILNRGNLEGWW